MKNLFISMLVCFVIAGACFYFSDPEIKLEKRYNEIVRLIQEGKYLEAELKIPTLTEDTEGNVLYEKINGKSKWVEKRARLQELLERERSKSEEKK